MGIMPRVKNPADGELVLLVNLGHAAEQSTAAEVAATLSSARAQTEPSRILTVSANRVTGAWLRTGSGELRAATRESGLPRWVGKQLPPACRWKPGARHRVKYAHPRDLDLTAYPLYAVARVGEWALVTDGQDLVVTGPRPLHVISLMGGEVRMRPAPDTPAESSDPRASAAHECDAENDDAPMSDDMTALMASIRAGLNEPRNT